MGQDGHTSPAVTLIGVDPSFDISGVLGDGCIEAFNTVGRAETFAEKIVHSKSL